MSVLFIEGFETSADQTDLTKRGLLSATAVGNSGCGVVPIPSRTGVAGTGLFLRGPYGNGTALPCPGSTTSDFGMLPIGQSVYSLWQSGGFAIGINASFNSLNTFQVAPGDTQQLAYDGSTYYWAICYTGSAYVVAYSSDLKNWTQTAAQPGNIGISATIAVAAGSGSGATVLVNNNGTSSTGYQTYYTTNLGAAWTAMSSVNVNYGTNFATSASTAPYVGMEWINTVGYKLYYRTSLTGTDTLVSSSPVIVAASANYIGAFGKQINGQILIGGHKTNSGAVSFPASGYTTACATCPASADPTVIGNWVVLAASPQMLNDLVYFKGYVIGVGYNGLWYNSNTGASAWTLGTGIPSSGTFTVSAVAANSNIAVAVGTDPSTTGLGAIWTSTNGTTWTKANRFLFNSAAPTSSAIFTSVMWDGSRFIATGGLNNNIVAVSTDGLSWSVVYAADYAENTGTACMSFLGAFSGTQNPATGVFTPWGTAAGNVSGVGFTAAAVASSARTVTAASVTAGAIVNGPSLSVSAVAGALGAQPPSTLSHYYELVFVATGTPNLFNVNAFIDNVNLGSLGQFQLAATSDTTGVSQLFINFPRTGNFTQVDDIYLTNYGGASHNGRLGLQRIYPISASSDVQDQFTNSLAGTNAATVNSALSNAEGSVYSTNGTAQDIYGTTNGVPGSGVVVNAVQIEAYLSTYGSSSGGGQVGLQSNGVQKLSSSITTSATPARVAVIAETDPNTSAPWTISGLNAVDIVVGKTS